MGFDERLRCFRFKDIYITFIRYFAQRDVEHAVKEQGFAKKVMANAFFKFYYWAKETPFRERWVY